MRPTLLAGLIEFYALLASLLTRLLIMFAMQLRFNYSTVCDCLFREIRAQLNANDAVKPAKWL